jgi:uncharacterized membrane protein YoaK (UPF0700 family)
MEAPPPKPFVREAEASFLLSAVAGYVDTAGYIALFGLFTAHVTGNLVTIGAVVAEPASGSVIARLAMIPVFMAGVAAATLFSRGWASARRAPLVPLLAAQTALLAAFLAAGTMLAPRIAKAPDGSALLVVGAIGVMAMAVQNAVMRDVLSTFTPSTVMTGNVTQFVIDLVDAYRLRRAQDPAALAKVTARLRKVGIVLVGFVAGAASGAWLTMTYGLFSIAIPALLTAWLTISAARARRTPPS